MNARCRIGKHEVVSFDEQVSLTNSRFVVSLPDAEVTISLADDRRRRLRWACSACETACVHAGLAFSLVLEEKMALGLAAPPRERKPVESLDERTLVERALADREERARTERMRVESTNPQTLWSDYLVTSSVSGRRALTNSSIFSLPLSSTEMRSTS